MAKLRDTVVFDPNMCVNSLAATEIWGSDPVHPRPEIYSKLAADLLDVQAGLKRKAPAGGEVSNYTKRARLSNRDGGVTYNSRGGVGGMVQRVAAATEMPTSP